MNINQESINNLSWPLKIKQSITITSPIILNSTEHYFIVDASNLIIHGNNHIISLVNINNYPGLIQNGTNNSSVNYDNIIVKNIQVVNISSTLQQNAGYIGQSYFGNNKSFNTNYRSCKIYYCNSKGNVPNYGGGIIGSNCASYGGKVDISYSYSHGDIGEHAGGIIGYYCGKASGNVNLQFCYSVGNIKSNGGGIIGSYAATGYPRPFVNASKIYINNCFSTGNIGTNAGGIIGSHSTLGSQITSTFFANISTSRIPGLVFLNNCYSQGIINGGGGLAGSFYDTLGSLNIGSYNTLGTLDISNCYSSGKIINNGSKFMFNPPAVGDNYKLRHSYSSIDSANGEWNSQDAVLDLRSVKFNYGFSTSQDNYVYENLSQTPDIVSIPFIFFDSSMQNIMLPDISYSNTIYTFFDSSGINITPDYVFGKTTINVVPFDISNLITTNSDGDISINRFTETISNTKLYDANIIVSIVSHIRRYNLQLVVIPANKDLLLSYSLSKYIFFMNDYIFISPLENTGYAYSNNLPSGLTILPNGVIKGVVEKNGKYNVTVYSEKKEGDVIKKISVTLLIQINVSPIYDSCKRKICNSFSKRLPGSSGNIVITNLTQASRYTQLIKNESIIRNAKWRIGNYPTNMYGQRPGGPNGFGSSPKNDFI
tara:strand:+ start:3529 stop:5490 length:1962 start_codon:yes stop_codon:yes gene_type:complete